METRIAVDCFRRKFGALALRAYGGDEVHGDLQDLLTELVAHSRQVAPSVWQAQLKVMRAWLRTHLVSPPRSTQQLKARAADPGFERQDRFYEQAIAELTKRVKSYSFT